MVPVGGHLFLLLYGSSLPEFRPPRDWVSQSNLCMFSGISEHSTRGSFKKRDLGVAVGSYRLDIYFDVHPGSRCNSLSLNFVDWNSLLYW